MGIDANEVISGFKSPEGKKHLNEIIEGLVRDQKITEEIVKTEDYINWLEKFIISNKNFHDDDWLYCPEKISQDDKDNVLKLSNLYSAIQNYANENFIYGIQDEFGDHYKIKYNNVGYVIGVMIGQGTIFWVKKQRLTNKNLNDFIDFNIIKENKINDRAEIIAKKLLDLESYIDDLANNDIPIKAIEDTTNKRLQLLRVQKKDNKSRI